MELVVGGTLAVAMERHGGSIPWRDAAQVGHQVASALAFAHQRGVIHRDVTPINMPLTSPEGGDAKITDFGLAKLLESTVHTREGALLGSAR